MKHEITASIVYRPEDGNCIAIANVTIDTDFVIGGVKLLEGSKGVFIAMPQRKTSTGEYKDIAFPLSGELRQQIYDAVVDAEAEENEKPRQQKKPVNSRGNSSRGRASR